MISFKEFLTESIIIGKPVSEKTYVFLSGQGLKYILLLGATDVTLNGNDVYIHVKYSATEELRNKIAKVINDAALEGKAYYHWSDIITKDIANKIKPTIRDYKMLPVDTKMILPNGFEKLADESFAKSFDTSISITNIMYGHKYKGLPEIEEAQNRNDAAAFKKLIAMHINKFDISKWIYLVSGDYCVIDHKAKTINVVDNTQKYQTRMRSFKGKSEYVLPLNDFTLNEQVLTKILIALCKHDKNYRSYTVPDVYIPIPVTYSAGDIVDGVGRIADTAAHFDSKFKTAKSIKVYHGTSMNAWNNLISKQGLRPGRGEEYVDKIKGHSDHLVYFTHSIAEARQYAVRAGGGRGSAILEVEIHDFTKIKFDEDNLQSALKRMPSNVFDVVKARLVQLWPGQQILNWQDDPTVPFSQKGVEPWMLRKLFEGNLTLPQKKLLDFIGGYAVSSVKQTFGYKGYVLPKDIKLVEHFKSTSTKDDTETYNANYSKVLSTFKSFIKR